ncbi:saccharopine dehydrogenase-like oxidoreductase [Corticium candelabrum]|uniref:saccharopine dehydrogenase-like oxidoreductase n=1 Tax=Corticium candelabrum TaxID=121492 RepID=UPI002E270B7A|nr:saccharopine dehydrogenase-like oxidoreductase [Corticium candelabrum]
MTEEAKRTYELVVFGASGYTGEFVAERVAKRAREVSLSWAVAGRNLAKLQKVVDDIAKSTGGNPSDVGIIEADIEDETSLKQMCASCKVLLNCVGPYRFYGEPVVKACVEEKCDYVDISGEPQFLETMQLKYNEKARDNGVHIVGTCGFDSIPADIGTLFAREKFPVHQLTISLH